MNTCSEGLVVPQECVRWCQSQDYGVMVGGDMAAVDLDWWSTRLESHRIPVQLWGRDADGEPVKHGKAFLSRATARGEVAGVELPARFKSNCGAWHLREMGK